MKVICKRTLLENIDHSYVTTVMSDKFDYNMGGYGVEVDLEYIVMGVVVYSDSSCPYFLIDANGKPDWYPNVLFEISDSSIPKQWSIQAYKPEERKNISIMFGFYELCNDEGYYDSLADRDQDALKVYFKRKVEIEA